MRRVDPVNVYPHFRSHADEVRYAAAMAKLCEERGFRDVAQGYRLALLDCPPGCTCSGCVRVRDEVASVTAARKAHGKRRVEA